MAHPTVTIGARTFALIVSPKSEYYCSLWGYDYHGIIQSLITPLPDPCRLAFMYQFLAIATAHEFTSAMPKQKPLHAEDWLDFIDAAVPETESLATPWVETARGKVVTGILGACKAAIVKRWSERKAKAGPTPTTENPAPTQTAPVQ